MRTRLDLSGYWHGTLTFTAEVDVAAPPRVEREFFVPLPWNSQVEHLRWPGPTQELSGIVRPLQNQNFRDVQRKFNEGLITYRRTIPLPPAPHPRRTFLVFEGSNYRTRVAVNGRAVGEHDGGHLGFEFEITDAIKEGDNTFEITVDNFRRKDACPQEQFNWQNHGGIYRPVYVEWRPEAFIASFHVNGFKRERGRHWARLVVLTQRADGASLQAVVGDGTGESRTGEFTRSGDAWQGWVSWADDGSDDACWPGRLHGLRIELRDAGGNLLDERRSTIGFRSAEFRDQRFVLNDKPLRLLGAAWHEQHPTFGSSVPEWQVTHDIQLMKHAGLNAIRAAHYPHAQAFYDACDREGMLVVAELPCWQFNEHHFQSAAVLERCRRMAREMVEQLGRHPCIVGWMVQNESKTFAPGAVEFFTEIAAAFKDADPSRFTLSAESPEPPEHLEAVKKVSGEPKGALPPTTACVDVVGVNCYAGWYAEKASFLPALLDHARPQLNGKPLLVTEFGAEGIPGERSLQMHPWTEDYQSELLCRHLRAILERDFVAGFFLWLFIDYEAASISIRAINAKGLVDEHRRPKLAFNQVKALLEALAPGAR